MSFGNSYFSDCGRVMRYLITFSYDGTNFNGYQKQAGLRTVQDEIEIRKRAGYWWSV